MASSAGKFLLFWKVVSTGPLRRLKLLARELSNENGVGIEELFRRLQDTLGRNALHIAARSGITEICDYLINEMNFNVNMLDFNGDSPLEFAVLRGHLQTTQFLIGIGANLSIIDRQGASALHLATMKGYRVIMELLISKGSPIDVYSSACGTALQCAATAGNPEAVKILLGHKPNLNLITYHSVPPLVTAMVSKSAECVRLLLEAGADPNIGACGHPPLSLVVGVEQGKIIKYLLGYGADPNAIGMAGTTALEEAALAGKHECMQILFPVTARIHFYTDWSISGIMKDVSTFAEQVYICFKQKLSLVRLLLLLKLLSE